MVGAARIVTGADRPAALYLLVSANFRSNDLFSVTSKEVTKIRLSPATSIMSADNTALLTVPSFLI